jgi:hypothetical protein
MADDFETAYRRARHKIGEAEWASLSDQEQEEAVNAELRALEAERRGGTPHGSSRPPDK